MGKLKLELDALEVESFDVGTSTGPRGTVKGHTGSPGVLGSCAPETCGGGSQTINTACGTCAFPCNTYQATCLYGGGNTCAGVYTCVRETCDWWNCRFSDDELGCASAFPC